VLFYTVLKLKKYYKSKKKQNNTHKAAFFNFIAYICTIQIPKK